MEDRVIAIETLCYEANCRIQDPVYGCVGLIPWLEHELNITQTQLAKTRAKLSFVHANNVARGEPFVQQNGA